MGRTLALGDVHGGAAALRQVLNRASFDDSEDRLIFLGDVADGWPETKEAVDVLLSIPNAIFLRGNHDEWVREWMNTGDRLSLWYSQGGQETIQSYARDQLKFLYDVSIWKNVPESHREFFNNSLSHYVDVERNFLFVHAGFHPHIPLARHTMEMFIWDRDLWYIANHTPPQEKLTPFDRVFVGHTSVGAGPPIRGAEVWNLDTGGGWEGVLTIMDVDTEEYWQSDKVMDLYPTARGRR